MDGRAEMATAGASGLSLLRRGDRLTCRVSGCTRLETLDAYLVQVAEDCRRRPVAAVLVDLTEADDLVCASDRLRLGFRLAEAWPPQVPMAVLVLPEMHLPDRSFEHLACRGGRRVRSFSDRTEAWHWLARQVEGARRDSG
ncbi:hypothetical protein [Arenimonas composti]|uniref:STAS/SEC14 domain-containing protein n=1 Tax=Arenimonas composti TR7-09 = DSM 18010 TaxID=1121013 RepID=A0A091C0W5_9GAMM|nr:hypothetical protein [Arenimonas composti]KFN50270.1 hypothetical protein P873_07890 [Arenimonas composti TR7-09 = DSM 18010]